MSRPAPSSSDIQAQPETAAIFDRMHAGNFEEARVMADALIAQEPSNAVAYYLRGVIYKFSGDLNNALLFFNKALKLKPDFRKAINDLAHTLQQTGQYRLAIKMCEHLIRIEQSEATKGFYAFAPLTPASEQMMNEWNTKGKDAFHRGQRDKAAEFFRKALNVKPDNVDILVNLSVALWALGKNEESEQTLLECLRISPGHADALNQLGNSYKDRRFLVKAIAAYTLSHAADPKALNALANLGKAYFELQFYDDSINAYERALAVSPHSLEMLQELIYLRQMICRWQDLPELKSRIIQAIEQGGQAGEPFIAMAYASAKLQKDNAVRWSQKQHPGGLAWKRETPLPAVKRADGKLHIGYLSSDFQRHATLALISEMFAHHDRGRFAIYAYSYGVDDGGPERQRARGLVDHFRDLYNVNDEKACDIIREDGIDILVDLKGFTQNHRLSLMARRPAPVQMHYLGFPGTTGSPFIDYFIADAIAAPAALDACFTEKLVRLPNSYQINDRTRIVPGADGPSRAEYGLPESGFVFCGFNNLYKITPELFSVWMRLLEKIEGSVLWVLETHEQSTANLKREAAARGIAPERIIPAAMTTQAEHLKRYRYADLLIDTAPVCGHTTTSDALWCGVPVVTIMGESFIANVAASLLHAVELPELVANTSEEYEAIALSLAQQPEKMARIRRHLEEGRMRFALFDSPATTRALEAAYLHAAELHRAGKAPQTFALTTELGVA